MSDSNFKQIFRRLHSNSFGLIARDVFVDEQLRRNKFSKKLDPIKAKGEQSVRPTDLVSMKFLIFRNSIKRK